MVEGGPSSLPCPAMPPPPPTSCHCYWTCLSILSPLHLFYSHLPGLLPLAHALPYLLPSATLLYYHPTPCPTCSIYNHTLDGRYCLITWHACCRTPRIDSNAAHCRSTPAQRAAPPFLPLARYQHAAPPRATATRLYHAATPRTATRLAAGDGYYKRHAFADTVGQTTRTLHGPSRPTCPSPAYCRADGRCDKRSVCAWSSYRQLKDL